MELHQIRAFVAVADRLSMTDAADYLHIAQPALTRKIQNLEWELGFTLFDRKGNKLSLTDAGLRFLLDARYIIELINMSVLTMRRWKKLHDDGKQEDGNLENFKL